MTIAARRQRRVRAEAGCDRIGSAKGSFVMTPDRANAARELLDFYAEAGVDALVGETPADRLATAQADITDMSPRPERQPTTHFQRPLPDIAPAAAVPAAPAA